MMGEVVLVIDDNPVNLRLTSLVLASEGFEVATARDAEDALAVIGVRRPRLVLTDLQLPGMDGLALTRRLKADPETRGIVVVALTAFAMMGDEARALEAGCDGYLTKPIDTRTLGPVVARLLTSGAR